MHTDLYLQQVHAAYLDSKRLNDALRNEQLRLAREGRPKTTTMLLARIGTAMIALGQRLQAEPAYRRRPQTA